jgi:hypothetical protein
MNDFVDSHALNFTVLAVLDDMNAGGWWKTNRAHVTFGRRALTETKNSFLKYWNRRAARLSSPLTLSSPLKQPAHHEQPAQAACSSLSKIDFPSHPVSQKCPPKILLNNFSNILHYRISWGFGLPGTPSPPNIFHTYLLVNIF